MATEEVGYVLAQSEKDGITVDATAMMGTTGKQGHVFFGCCCDVRRAVIIVNIISIVFVSFGLLVMGAYKFSCDVTKAGSADTYDNDGEEWEAITRAFNGASLSMGDAIIWAAIRISAYVLGITGAVWFNDWMMIDTLVVYCFDFVMAAVAVNVTRLVMAALFAYPHFFFIKEVRSGIMSQSNYRKNERLSCCCV
jgi:hypothetical protein